MNERRCCLAYSLWRRAPIFSCESCNSAQFRTPHARFRVELELPALFTSAISEYHLLGFASGHEFASTLLKDRRGESAARPVRHSTESGRRCKREERTRAAG